MSSPPENDAVREGSAHETDVCVESAWHPSGAEYSIAIATCNGCGWTERGDESDVRDAAAQHERNTGSPPPRAQEPGMPPARLVFQGRTGAGRDIAVYVVGAWLDVLYYDVDGEVRGFALNPLYLGKLFEGLSETVAERAQEWADWRHGVSRGD